jgi:hypothetical protein
LWSFGRLGKRVPLTLTLLTNGGCPLERWIEAQPQTDFKMGEIIAHNILMKKIW